MKTVFGRHRCSWFVVFCSAVILAIVACNVWLLCCGRCVINDYLRIPPIGWVLIVANLVAGIVLLLVRRRNKTRPGGDFCGVCRTALRKGWVYCPHCGDKRCA